MPPPEHPFFDAHLDLAYMAVAGRDMFAEDPTTAGGEDPPGAITFSSMRRHIGACLGTIFVEPAGKPSNYSYPAGDAEAAARAGDAQLQTYLRWQREGLIRLPRAGESFGSLLRSTAASTPLAVGILIEGADPIASPDELPRWRDQGVVAVGLAWARASRYAAGNATPAAEDRGLTDLGRAMIPAMDALGIIHDLSHLSDRGLDELLTRTSRPVIASHSNVRAIVDRGGAEVRQRHLRDDTIREIARRGGMIGVNLFSPFIITGARRDRRATLDEWADHVEHICAIAGRRDVVGLGSDMDGGFSARMMPEGVNLPGDLRELTAKLTSRGWSPAQCAGFAWDNWARFFG
jgi:membrane dipeptidase